GRNGALRNKLCPEKTTRVHDEFLLSKMRPRSDLSLRVRNPALLLQVSFSVLLLEMDNPPR
ncbi:MAG: hypothetical protein Q4C87_00500, partial [Actinomycetaceae bacterium]|nr:hypothetical protein [Actinomycetaceae bacterium]